MPDAWKSDSWLTGPGISSYGWHRTANGGELTIINHQPNDARWVQHLHLAPGWYRFTAEVRATKVGGDHLGASIAVMQGWVSSADLRGNQDWQSLEFYLHVGGAGADVELACRLGGFSNENIGEADCRNIHGYASSAPPPSSARAFDLGGAPLSQAPSGAGSGRMLLLAGGIVLMLALIGWRYSRVNIEPSAGPNTPGEPPVIRSSGLPAAGSRDASQYLYGQRFSFFLVFFLFLTFYALTSGEKTHFDEHVRLADALLHGHAWIEPPPSYMERAHYGGHDYIVHPPLPALMMVPLVAIFGPSLNQTWVSVAVGAFSVALIWRLCGLIAKDGQVWLTLFFGIGTTFWYEATLGDSWSFAVVMSVPATTLALNELFGKARPLVVGLCAGFAALARYDLVLAWPFYLALLWARGKSWRTLWALGGFAIAAAISVSFNEIRFGTVTDISLWLFVSHDAYLQARMGGGPPLQLRFLPVNLYALLFMAPVLNESFPYIHPQIQGQALLLTSPGFLLALRPNFRRAIPLLLLLAAGVSMGPVLLWYGNGFMQFGMRFYVQVFPFLMVLMALGARELGIDQMGKILIVISMLLVAYGTWHIRTLGFA